MIRIRLGRWRTIPASRAALAIVIFAIALRIAFTFGVQRGVRHIAPENEITDNYHRIAESLLRGEGYRELPEHPPSVRRPPAYPVLLYASFRAFGVDYRIVQILQAILGGVSCWLLYQLGRWARGPELGLVAALLFAFYPPALEYAAMLCTENLFFPLLFGFALFLCRAAGRDSARDGALAGAFWGFGLLTRGTLMAFPLALPAILLLHGAHRRSWKRWFRWAIPALVTGVLVLVPWTARNYRLTGEVVPVSSWGWAPFYHGIQVSKQMLRWGDLRAVDSDADRRRHDIVVERLYAGERAKAWASTHEMVRHERVARDLVLEEIRKDPAGWAARGVAGTVFTWFQTLGAKKRVLSLAVHLPLMVLFAVGLRAMARERRGAFARLYPALAVILFVNLFQGFVFPFVRYMAPAIALSFVFSGWPIVKWLQGRIIEAHHPDPGV